MFRTLGHRAFLTLINIFFPPLTVMLLTGLETDTLINSCLFLCGVIPSHIHGFYISCTYFHRKRKVKKGRYPGGEKPLIFSQKVINGGASNVEVDELWRKERGLEKKSSGVSKTASRKEEPGRTTSRRHGTSQRHGSRRDGMGRQGVTDGFDGFGTSSETGYTSSRRDYTGGGGQVSRVGSRAGAGVGHVDSRMSRGNTYGSVQSSPISPQSKHWR